MNIFQQVFASVDPKASQLVKASENINDNVFSKKEKEILISDNITKNKKTSKKEKQIKSSNSKELPQSIKIDYKPSTYQTQSSSKAPSSVIPVSSSMKKVQKNKEQSNDQNAKENLLNKDDIINQINQLEQKYEELSEQYNKISASYDKSKMHNEKLISQNFELEMEIQKLKEATKDSNNRLLEMKQDYEDRAKERDDSWEFKINELMMELEVMKDSNK